MIWTGLVALFTGTQGTMTLLPWFGTTSHFTITLFILRSKLSRRLPWSSQGHDVLCCFLPQVQNSDLGLWEILWSDGRALRLLTHQVTPRGGGRMKVFPHPPHEVGGPPSVPGSWSLPLYGPHPSHLLFFFPEGRAGWIFQHSTNSPWSDFAGCDLVVAGSVGLGGGTPVPTPHTVNVLRERTPANPCLLIES